MSIYSEEIESVENYIKRVFLQEIAVRAILLGGQWITGNVSLNILDFSLAKRNLSQMNLLQGGVSLK
ncbi:MAG: hypothetical protein AAGF93_02575 [Cyanobacteria bacterium P01_H01_bin.105]